MKKIFSMMVAMATLLSFVACGEDTSSTGGGTQKEGKLDTPVLTIAEQTADSVTISWGAVADAVSYSVALDTDLSTTDKTSVTFTGLSIGKYAIRVKAIAATMNADYTAAKQFIANDKSADADYLRAVIATKQGDMATAAAELRSAIAKDASYAERCQRDVNLRGYIGNEIQL